jgi:hypothetical protein
VHDLRAEEGDEMGRVVANVVVVAVVVEQQEDLK